MSKRIRGAVLTAVAGVFLTACTTTAEPDAAAPLVSRPPAASSSKPAAESPAPSPAAPRGAAELVMGETGRWDDTESDGAGGDPVVHTTFEVTAEDARYVSAAEAGAPSPPKRGQYVILTLTIKNVGPKAAGFTSAGVIKWENEGTPARGASTSHSVGGPDLDTTYAPGQSVTGKLLLDVGGTGGLVSYYDGAATAFTISLPRP
ncbi:hypothetical protein [Streptomyces sp. CAU 1734]|uniref:hypothetical protein n=1 Tax=Streptomyces sp. CAU 1734 TaxID=3140360 RepID=UPI0032608BC4